MFARMRWLLRLLSLPIITCLFGSCAAKNHLAAKPLLQFGEARSASLPNRFELLNWNVYKGRRPNFSREFQRLATAAEIITLQEASTCCSAEMQNIQKVLPPGRLLQMVGVLQYADGQAGVATVSTARTQRVFSVPSPDGEPLVNLRKSSIITTYGLAGSSRSLMVANTHGLNLPGKLWFGQASFERQIRDVAEMLARHDGPIMWAGDFNTHDAGKTVALKALTDRLGLVRVPVRHAERLMHSKVAALEIDHVYVRGLKASAEAVEHHDSSDHAPILVWLSLP